MSNQNKLWKKTLLVLLLIFLVVSFVFISEAEARSGCCSHHGGVCTYECPDGVNIGYCCCDGTSLSAKCAPYYASCPLAPLPKEEPELPKTDYTTLVTADVEVIRVVDGDTIEVKFSDGATEKVRLIGIDTPETVDPRKPVECFGREASVKMKELVEGKTVRLERKADKNRGSYGRLLRYLYVDDLFVNAEMIKEGYAYAYIKYPFDSKLMEEFKQYEKEARENERGLWASGVCETKAEIKPSLPEEIKNQASESDNFIYWLIGIPLFGIAVIIFLIYRNKYEQKN